MVTFLDAVIFKIAFNWQPLFYRRCERSEANQRHSHVNNDPGLLRYARNDGILYVIQTK